MGGVNTPFLVRWPGVVPAGRVDKETALAGVDMFPTLLAATGTAPPKDYASDGENMLAAFKGRPATSHQAGLLVLARRTRRRRLARVCDARRTVDVGSR